MYTDSKYAFLVPHAHGAIWKKRGFSWNHGRITKTITTPANLPYLRQRWTRSVFKWYDHLASIFVPSAGLGDIMWHEEALNKYTTKALNDSLNSISQLNTKVSQICKAVLQNRMALDVLTAAQGSTCAIIKTECCVYIPDYHKNVTGLIKDMNTQTKAYKILLSLSVNG